MPQALINRIRAAANFNQGFQTGGIVGLVHDRHGSTYADEHSGRFQYRRLRAHGVGEIPHAARDRAPPPAHAFGHIFSGGYAAGYYGYIWAEVISADAFAHFEASGDDFKSHARGELAQNILSVGNTRPEMESYVAWRGQQPTTDALLRARGFPVRRIARHRPLICSAPSKQTPRPARARRFCLMVGAAGFELATLSSQS